MSDNVELQMAIAMTMVRMEAKLLTADVDTSVRCAHALAANLGCVMANMLAKEGEEKFETALQTVMTTARQHARDTVLTALRMGQDPTIGTVQ